MRFFKNMNASPKFYIYIANVVLVTLIALFVLLFCILSFLWVILGVVHQASSNSLFLWSQESISNSSQQSASALRQLHAHDALADSNKLLREECTTLRKTADEVSETRVSRCLPRSLCDIKMHEFLLLNLVISMIYNKIAIISKLIKRCFYA